MVGHRGRNGTSYDTLSPQAGGLMCPVYNDANLNDYNLHASFRSDIRDDIVAEFTVDDKPVTVTFKNNNNTDLIDLIRRFGIDSFEFKDNIKHPCSHEQTLLIAKAFLAAYSLN